MANLERCISVPYHGKQGEDRWAWGRNTSGSTAWVLCDGASESYDASGWAATLARSIVDSILNFEKFPRTGCNTIINNRLFNLDRCIYRARRIYQQNNQTKLSADDWLSRASQARGSWATLLALRLSPSGKALTVWAMGDTELFVLDRYQDILHLPISASKEFSATPPLIGSTVTSRVPQCGFWHINLHGLSNPRLVLCTDALAAFILTIPETGRRAWWEFITKAPLKTVVEELVRTRNSGALAADDYTLLELRP